MITFQFVFSISHYGVTSWEKDAEWAREWDSVTDRRREGREGESCCDSLFTPREWRFFFFFFLPPVSILSGLQSVNLSRVIWPRHCVNLEYSSGSFFASRGLRLCWGSDGIPQNVTTMCNLVDVDVVWRLVRTWVSSFRWTIKLSLTGWTKTKHLNQLQ